ncbi:MAG TPA: helix-turn-helix domain-containing protein [Candidatus Kapabacteria bacterium]|nr:helix-turn-helix domain-containing protein [Candidatus Kapabacteria bacterium]
MYKPIQTIQIQNVSVNELINQFKAVVEDVISKMLKNDKNLITADELARWLGVSKSSLWRYEQQGLLHPIRIGKNKIYNLDEVREAFANRY